MIQENKECFFCLSTQNLERHHIFYGTANRAKSEKYNLCIWLCAKHHRDHTEGVHFSKNKDGVLKIIAQEEFEKEHTREEFIKEFGKSWI